MKVFAYCELFIIAPSRNVAIDILKEHLGCSGHALLGTREVKITQMTLEHDDGSKIEVDHDEFCRIAQTFGGRDDEDRKRNIGICADRG